MESRITGDLAEALSGEMTPKFIATVDKDGLPNLVLLVSLEPDTETRMAYGEFLLNKTAKNLDTNTKCGILVITEQLSWWSLTGDHVGYEKAGPLVDRFNSKEMFRYNAYMGIRRAGLIDLRSVEQSGKVGKLTLAADFGLARLSRGRFAREGVDKLPLPVHEKFARLQAVKILSYVGPDGYPVCMPIMSMQPADHKTLVFGTLSAPNSVEKIPEGTTCAINVVTFDPISYQVKGSFTGYRGALFGKRGAIEIESVWSTSPPLPGERIDADTRKL
jgi:Pyridoxamine 5'-phosphate oxidase